MKSYRVNDKLFLNVVETFQSNTAPPPPPPGVNLILWTDVSGSMSGDLPAMRVHLKNRLATMLGPQDTVTLGWFSSRGEFGLIVEGAEVNDAPQLTRLQAAIDRFLKPVGLTGFLDPLRETKALIQRLKKNGKPAVFMFLSDGYDNQSSQAEYLAAARALADSADAATVVEYGYYADRKALTRIAEEIGGSLVFAKDFPEYEVVLNKQVVLRPEGNRLAVNLPMQPLSNLAFALRDGQTISIEVPPGGAFTVDASIGEVAFFTETAPKQVSTSEVITALIRVATTTQTNYNALAFMYAGLALFANRMQTPIVKQILAVLGDVRLINQFVNCFGKQAYSSFVKEATDAAYLPVKRWVDGYDTELVPPPDSFNVLDFLTLLSSDEENRVLLNSPEFKYDRISLARLDAATVLTADEQEKVAEITAEMAKTRDTKKIAELSAQIAAITNKPGPIKFVEEKDDDTDYPVNSLTFNESRPNVSILVQRHGYLDLSGQANRPDNVPERFPHTAFRNYSIVTDGIVNVAVLPVRLSEDTRKVLKDLAKSGRIPAGVFTAKGAVVDGAFKEEYVSVNLSKLPVINAQMTTDVSAVTLAKEELDLLRLKANQKVINHWFTTATGSRTSSVGLKETYGEASAKWLADVGITDRGFSPSTVKGEARDFYIASELNVKIAGASKLPSVNEVAKGGKSLGHELVRAALAQYGEEVVAKGGVKLQDEARKLVRKKSTELARIKFGLLVGQTWFKEFASLDENVLDNGVLPKTTFELSQPQIEI